MHTLGYDFKPWEAEKSIADGPSILSYVNETADEYRIRERIRFSQKARSRRLVQRAWSVGANGRYVRMASVAIAVAFS